KDNNLIWHLPKDLKFFKETTTGHYVIQGRKTFESCGKPLPNRTNVIITRDKNFKVDGCIVIHSLQEALDLVKNESEAFIIGGGNIYEQAMPFADRIYLTKIIDIFRIIN
ncbi:MAG: Dihydrofolate reductase, partial [Candidatus Falkowbacteria bacterium GW2011_GWF2_39_8]